MSASRRKFIKEMAIIGAGLTIIPRHVLGRGAAAPSDRLNIAAVGVGGQGRSNLLNLAAENIVALCDVDDKYLAATAQKFPGAKTYNDFRRLLEQKDIDALVIATPDHTHAVATVAALRSGRHVYCEKPLTRTISECLNAVNSNVGK